MVEVDAELLNPPFASVSLDDVSMELIQAVIEALPQDVRSEAATYRFVGSLSEADVQTNAPSEERIVVLGSEWFSLNFEGRCCAVANEIARQICLRDKGASVCPESLVRAWGFTPADSGGNGPGTRH